MRPSWSDWRRTVRHGLILTFSDELRMASSLSPTPSDGQVRAGQLGHDRHFNAYFWFPSDAAGLYVQPAEGMGMG